MKCTFNSYSTATTDPVLEFSPTLQHADPGPENPAVDPKSSTTKQRAGSSTVQKKPPPLYFTPRARPDLRNLEWKCKVGPGCLIWAVILLV